MEHRVQGTVTKLEIRRFQSVSVHISGLATPTPVGQNADGRTIGVLPRRSRSA